MQTEWQISYGSCSIMHVSPTSISHTLAPKGSFDCSCKRRYQAAGEKIHKKESSSSKNRYGDHVCLESLRSQDEIDTTSVEDAHKESTLRSDPENYNTSQPTSDSTVDEFQNEENELDRKAVHTDENISKRISVEHLGSQNKIPVMTTDSVNGDREHLSISVSN